ncbi:hypothetical protein J3F84DRAFT_391351 [Trichoderma pleuroticola]
MDLRKQFLQDGSNLSTLLDTFHLDVGIFLTLLRKLRAVASGMPLVFFMGGLWKKQSKESCSRLVLDILCCESSNSTALADVRAMLVDEFYYSGHAGACTHHWGEWNLVPPSKRLCFIRETDKLRVIHVVLLPRSPVETIVSRSYGHVGVYLTGGGQLVSLFPRLTFLEKKYWLPSQYTGKLRALVASKYYGLKMIRNGESSGEEVGATNRTVLDSLCWRLLFNRETGVLLPERGKKLDGENSLSLFVKTEVKSSSVAYATLFPSMKAAMNKDGELFDYTYWFWIEPDFSPFNK